MMMSDDELRAIWQHRSTDVPSTRAACLTEAEWARLLSKEAEGAERARAAAHIASCTECADEYHLLQPLQSWSAEVERALSPGDAAHFDRSTGWHARDSTAEEHRSWRDLLGPYVSSPWPARQLGLAAAATLLLATGTLWLSRDRGPSPDVPSPEARSTLPSLPPAPDPSSPAPPSDSVMRPRTVPTEPPRAVTPKPRAPSRAAPALAVWTLSPSLVRGTGPANTFAEPAATVSVRFRLAGVLPNKVHGAKITTAEGQVLWDSRQLDISGEARQRTIAVTVPARLLQPGDYVLTLYMMVAKGGEEPIQDYVFAVMPPVPKNDGSEPGR